MCPNNYFPVFSASDFIGSSSLILKYYFCILFTNIDKIINLISKGLIKFKMYENLTCRRSKNKYFFHRVGSIKTSEFYPSIGKLNLVIS